MVLVVIVVSGSWFFFRPIKVEPPSSDTVSHDVQWQMSTVVGRKEGVRQWQMDVATMTQEGDLVYLSGIERVIIYDEDREVYYVQAEQGIWRRKTNDLELTGQIVVTGEEDFVLYTDELHWSGVAERLTAPNWVELESGGTVVRADTMVATVKDDLVHLKGDVEITEGRQRWLLDHVIYNTKEETMEILGVGVLRFID